ncbi:hypothetical protein BDZ89DRAFT_133337 [Hymenopellis radicata]|nr:hypothetical protein BDZ89DRAFT_133337 [Hymenopellis radicata]
MYETHQCVALCSVSYFLVSHTRLVLVLLQLKLLRLFLHIAVPSVNKPYLWGRRACHRWSYARPSLRWCSEGVTRSERSTHRRCEHVRVARVHAPASEHGVHAHHPVERRTHRREGWLQPKVSRNEHQWSAR